jgi:SHS2 domain-containing protein
MPRGRGVRVRDTPDRGTGLTRTATHGGRYDYFDHDSDVGIRAQGATLEDVFANTARALFSIEADLARVRTDRSIGFSFDEDDVELALVAWLNGVLARAHCERLVPSQFRVERRGVHWICEATGEAWRSGIARGVEVKGATLTGLTVHRIEDGWEARLVVDV